jgi:Flp pilus assembly protein TadD
MKPTNTTLPLSALVLAASLVFSQLSAAPSASKAPEPDPAVQAYNAGTEALLDLDFQAAEADLRRAIEAKPDMAEAHNNLAYALRKQGESHFAEALKHYNRAVELDPRLAEAYMYRGVLYVQMGDTEAALKDHAMLLELDNKLAGELEAVVTSGEEKTPEQFFGVTDPKDA